MYVQRLSVVTAPFHDRPDAEHSARSSTLQDQESLKSDWEIICNYSYVLSIKLLLVSLFLIEIFTLLRRPVDRS